jgi:hypothetical protein
MKHFVLLCCTTIFILVVLIEPAKVEFLDNPEEKIELDSSDVENLMERLDWSIQKNDQYATMKALIPFAENPDSKIDTFEIIISKPIEKNMKSKIELIAPASINSSKGIDIIFLQQLNLDDQDSIIWDGDGPIHLDLVASKEGKSIAAIPDGLLQLENGKPYDFIHKCNGFNQLLIEFEYKNRSKKSILQQLVTFTEYYRKIE